MSQVATCPTCGSKSKIKEVNGEPTYQALQDEEVLKKVGQLKKALQTSRDKVEALEKELEALKLNKKMNIEQNKKNAIAFYKMAYEGNPTKAVALYVGKKYIQHNPMVDNGPQPFIDYFNRMQKEYPVKSIEFVRSVAEGNLVALHTHQVWPDDDQYITMDFFRFDEGGKIVEHWDSIQQIPETSNNNNTMY